MNNILALFSNQEKSLDNAASSLFINHQQLVEKTRLEKGRPLHRRDIAQKLEVPEAALIDQQCGVKSIRLLADFAKIIYALPKLGYIMTLTRNDSAVHERKGIYSNVSVKGPMGLVITEDRKIDLRIIVSRWASGFAVKEPVGSGFRYSLQFFDQAGAAIQKIFLQLPDMSSSQTKNTDTASQSSDIDGYCEVVNEFVDAAASSPLSFKEITIAEKRVDSSQVDSEELIAQWQGMTNVHQFFGMLKKHKISREQAFSIVGAPLAQQFDPYLLEGLLLAVVKEQLPIMCFVGNAGNIQIHTGEIETVKRVGPWLNILDPEFNLHLLENNVANAWVIKKPTVDGDVTSVELYDAAGETIAQFFGQRIEGNPENTQWRAFAEGLLEQEVVA
ncbi:MAG: hemin transport protein HmuS [Osedax symbiont Rs1]|nr:MAG: hemin transport protein HmuS [Osedax symbiont Rs1]